MPTPPGRRTAIVTACIAGVVVAVATLVGWPNLRFWYLFEPLGTNTYGLLEYRHRKTGIIFVKLPGGTFRMGAQSKDPNGQNYDPDANADERPVHEVVLSPFMIGKYEVTQGQWKAIMASNPSRFKGDDDRPVDLVTWEDIQGFEAKTGLTLPTEAQWEYACRAGTTTPFAGMLEDLGWFDANSGGTTHPVGTKVPNGFGIHDIHGNVSEWCEDFGGDRFYSKSEVAGSDPDSSSGYGYRVVRGGSWYSFAWYCRSAARNWINSSGYDILGFRPAFFPLP